MLERRSPEYKETLEAFQKEFLELVINFANGGDTILTVGDMTNILSDFVNGTGFPNG